MCPWGVVSMGRCAPSRPWARAVPSAQSVAPVGALWLATLLIAGGCGTIVHDVRFSATPSFEPPATVTRVVVEVLDGSSEDNGIPLGRMTTPYSGGPEHRYVLVGEDSFAARLGRDVIAALRARGYQALSRSDTTPEASHDAIVLTIKTVTHAIDMAIRKSDVIFNGTFVFECAATRGGGSEWSETIDYHTNKQQFGWSKARVFEGVYWSAVVEIVHRFSTALPPSP